MRCRERYITSGCIADRNADTLRAVKTHKQGALCHGRRAGSWAGPRAVRATASSHSLTPIVRDIDRDRPTHPPTCERGEHVFERVCASYGQHHRLQLPVPAQQICRGCESLGSILLPTPRAEICKPAPLLPFTAPLPSQLLEAPAYQLPPSTQAAAVGGAPHEEVAGLQHTRPQLLHHQVLICGCNQERVHLQLGRHDSLCCCCGGVRAAQLRRSNSS